MIGASSLAEPYVQQGRRPAPRVAAGRRCGGGREQLALAPDLRAHRDLSPVAVPRRAPALRPVATRGVGVGHHHRCPHAGLRVRAERLWMRTRTWPIRSASKRWRHFCPWCSPSFPLLPLCMLACAVSLVLRFRRSHGIERQQVKWLASAAAAVASVYLLMMLVSWFYNLAGILPPHWLEPLGNFAILTFVLIPLAIGIAVLRYGLYGIDRLISRTLSLRSHHRTLLARCYLLLVTAVSRIAPDSGLARRRRSTLAVAALFQPLRRRVQTAGRPQIQPRPLRRRPHRRGLHPHAARRRSTSTPSGRDSSPPCTTRSSRRPRGCGCANRLVARDGSGQGRSGRWPGQSSPSPRHCSPPAFR